MFYMFHMLYLFLVPFCDLFYVFLDLFYMFLYLFYMFYYLFYVFYTQFLTTCSVPTYLTTMFLPTCPTVTTCSISQREGRL